MSDASPLSSTDPDALTALFEGDPLTLTEAQMMGLVVELRRRRDAFLAEEAAKALKPKSPRAKAGVLAAPAAAALDKPLSEINLDDL